MRGAGRKFTAELIQEDVTETFWELTWLEDTPPTPDEVLGMECVQEMIRETCGLLD